MKQNIGTIILQDIICQLSIIMWATLCVVGTHPLAIWVISCLQNHKDLVEDSSHFSSGTESRGLCSKWIRVWCEAIWGGSYPSPLSSSNMLSQNDRPASLQERRRNAGSSKGQRGEHAEWRNLRRVMTWGMMRTRMSDFYSAIMLPCSDSLAIWNMILSHTSFARM